MTFEKLLAEAMEWNELLEEDIRNEIIHLLDRYGCDNPENECDLMIDQFKEENQ